MFAIRQKSTGYFMPQFPKNTSKGGTWLEPKADAIPRLFRRKQDAKVALDCWLKGRLERKFYIDFDNGYEDCSLSYKHDPNRKPEDMEILEVVVVPCN